MEEVSVYQAAEDCLLRVEFQKLTELSQAIAVVKESLTSAEERVKRLYEGLREEKLVFWEAKQRLKEEQLSTQEERAQFAREATLVAERNAKASDVIRLNVGGAKYETTRSTLCSVPNSMLCAMFSGRHRLFADQEGRIFLDRDPEAFAYVLHFLRTGKYPQCFEDEDGDNIDPEEKTRVETEFDYFCLPLPGGRQGSGNGGYWGTWGETDEISDTSCIERAYLPDSKTLPLSGHTAPIWCVDSTDEYVVTGSDDCTVRVWDLEGRCVHVLQGHTGMVRSVAAADGYVISGSWDTTARVWRLSTGAHVHTLSGHRDVVSAVALASATAATCSWDRTVRVWDVQTGWGMYLLEDVNVSVGLAFYGSCLIGASGSELKVWDLPTGQCVRRLAGHTAEVRCVTVTGGRVVSRDQTNTFIVWNMPTGQPLHTVMCGNGASLTVCTQFACTAQSVLFANGGGIDVWDWMTGQRIPSIGAGSGQVVATAVCVKGQRLIVGCLDHTARVIVWGGHPARSRKRQRMETKRLL